MISKKEEALIVAIKDLSIIHVKSAKARVKLLHLASELMLLSWHKGMIYGARITRNSERR